MVPNIAYVSDGSTQDKSRGQQHKWLNHDRNGLAQGNGELVLHGFNGNGARDSIMSRSKGHDGWTSNVSIEPEYQKLPWVPANPNAFQFGGYQRKALSQVKPHEELEPVEYDHPLRRLIENPNPWDTWFDLVYESQMFLELCGVSYLWAVPNDWGVPAELWVIPAHWVWPRTGGGKYVPPDNPHADELIQYYEIRPWGGMGSAGIIKIPPDEIIMEYWKSPINKIDGYSKLSAAAMIIDTNESQWKCNWSQLQNQALPSCFVELPPDMEDPDDARARRLQARFMDHLQGEYNIGKPFVGMAGMKITPLSFSPESMMYGQTADQSRDMILSTFRVPGAAVGLVKEMTYGSVLSTLAGMCEFCINPRLQMRGQKWTKQLAPKFHRGREFNNRKRSIRVWYDSCTPHDPQQINSDIQLDWQCLAINPNEIRTLRGRKPWPYGGDNPMTQGPGGLMPLPWNKKEEMDKDVADLIGYYSQHASGQAASQEAQQQAQEQQQQGQQGGQGGFGLQPGQSIEEMQEPGQNGQPDNMNPGVENPNGTPSKSLNGVHKNGKASKIDNYPTIKYIPVWFSGDGMVWVMEEFPDRKTAQEAMIQAIRNGEEATYRNPEKQVKSINPTIGSKVGLIAGGQRLTGKVQAFRGSQATVKVTGTDGQGMYEIGDLVTIPKSGLQPMIGETQQSNRTTKTKSKVPTIAVDLDGTICSYTEWKGEDVFGDVRPGCVEALVDLKKRGWRIVIFTTRGNTDRIAEFLNDNQVPFDHINMNPDQPEGTSGKVIADVYVDDRAINAESDWPTILRNVLARKLSKGLTFKGKLVKKSKPPYKYQSTQANLPDLEEAAKRWVDGHIPEEVLLEKEDQIHTTVRYGIKENTNGNGKHG